MTGVQSPDANATLTASGRMKALTFHQPYATLIVDGIKIHETRYNPLNGMHPRGVRPLPGLPVRPGGWIAIHAGLSDESLRAIADTGGQLGPLHIRNTGDEGWAYGYGSDRGNTTMLHRGAVVGIGQVHGSIPMCAPGCVTGHRHIIVDDDQLTGFWTVPGTDIEIGIDLSYHRQFGFWEPGRWAIEFSDAIKFDEPIPCRGRQGVWRLPADVNVAVRAAIDASPIISGGTDDIRRS